MGKTIDEYKADWMAAYKAGDQAAMDAAHAGAEQVRAQSGYSGGADGSQVIVTDQAKYDASQASKSSGGSSGSGSSSKQSNSTYEPTYVEPEPVVQQQTVTEQTPAKQATYTQGTYSTSSNTGYNESVEAIQSAINDWIKSGASGSEGIALLDTDGRYGAKTKAAVTAYQKAKGIQVDGIVGNETAATMGLISDGKSNTANTTTAEEIQAQFEEQPQTQTQTTTTDTKDAELRTKIWDSSLDKYGSSANYLDAANNAYNAGDLASAAKLEALRNQYLEESGNTDWGAQTDTFIKQYEIYEADDSGNATKDNNQSNTTTYTKPTTSTVRTDDGSTITYYTFTDASGNEHISARTVSGDPVPVGTTIPVESTTKDGVEYTVSMTWNPDSFRDDTGSWEYTIKSTTDTVGYTPGSFTAFLATDEAQYIEQQTQNASDAEVAAINAATEKAINEIRYKLQASEAELAQMADEAYLQSKQTQDNLALSNQVSGNFGGIAQKQYSAAQASYDQQLLAISLQYNALKTEADYQIAQLRADGEIQAANAVAEWAANKLSTMISAYEWVEEMSLKGREFEYEVEVTDRNYALQRAQNMLQQGVLTADAVEALGVSPDDAEYLANYYNRLAQSDLPTASEGLKEIANSGDNSGKEPALIKPQGTLKDAGYVDENGKAIFVDEKGTGLFYEDGTAIPVGSIITDGTNQYKITEGGIEMYSPDGTAPDTGEPQGQYTGRTAKADRQSAATGTSFDSFKDWWSSGKTLESYLRDGGYSAADTSVNFYNATGQSNGLNPNTFTAYQKDQIYNAAKQVSDADYEVAVKRLESTLNNDQIWTLGAPGLVEYFNIAASPEGTTAADIAKTIVDDYQDGTLNYEQARILSALCGVADATFGYLNYGNQKQKYESSKQ